MKKRIISLAAAAMLLLSLTACSGTSPAAGGTEAPATGEPSATAEPTAQPIAEAREGVVGFSCVYSSKDNLADSGDVILLQSGSAEPSVTISGRSDAAAAIQADLTSELTVDDETIENNLQMAQELYTSMSEAGHAAEWQVFTANRTAKVTRGDAQTLSFRCTSSDFTGGAHGNYVSFGCTYSTVTGAKLGVSDIAADETALREYVKNYIINAAAQLEYADSLWSVDVFAEGALDAGQWCLTDAGLCVFSTAYEIGAYAMGEIDFVIPYSELGGLLADELIPSANASAANAESASVGRQADASGLAVTASATVDAEADGVYFMTNAALTDLRVQNVAVQDNGSYYYSDGTLAVTGEVFYLSSLEPGETCCVYVYMTDVPGLVLSYTNADGSTSERLICESGENGSLFLTEAA